MVCCYITGLFYIRVCAQLLTMIQKGGVFNSLYCCYGNLKSRLNNHQVSKTTTSYLETKYFNSLDKDICNSVFHFSFNSSLKKIYISIATDKSVIIIFNLTCNVCFKCILVVFVIVSTAIISTVSQSINLLCNSTAMS